MGNTSSKKKNKSNTKVWSNKYEVFVPNDYSVMDLSRSTFEDHNQNSLGLPDDVLCLITSFLLDVTDVANCSMVCKTWRRVCLKDVVWLVFAKRMCLDWDKVTPVRSLVLDYFGSNMKEDFSYFPHEITSVASDVYDSRTVHILMRGASRGGGQSSVILAFFASFFGNHEDLEEDTYRKCLTVDSFPFLLDILIQGLVEISNGEIITTKI